MPRAKAFRARGVSAGGVVAEGVAEGEAADDGVGEEEGDAESAAKGVSWPGSCGFAAGSRTPHPTPRIITEAATNA
jgi:hypothetical protein